MSIASTALSREEVRGWKGASNFAGKSVAQLKRDAAADLFPAPHVKGPNSLFWYLDELQAWRDALPRRIYGRRPHQPETPAAA